MNESDLVDGKGEPYGRDEFLKPRISREISRENAKPVVKFTASRLRGLQTTTNEITAKKIPMLEKMVSN